MKYVPAVSPKSRALIEKEAIAFQVEHFPKLLTTPGRLPVIKLFDDVLYSKYELETGVDDLPVGVEGMTWPDGRVLVSESTYELAIRGEGRARFTIVHEGYHGLAHRHQLAQVLVHTGGIVLHRRGDLQAFRDPEWQANTFASYILMPTATMKIVIARTKASALVAAVTEAFGVSRKAAEVRLQIMGVK